MHPKSCSLLFMAATALHLGCSGDSTTSSGSTSGGGGAPGTTASTSGAGGTTTAATGGTTGTTATGTGGGGGGPVGQAWKCPPGNYQSPTVAGLIAKKVANVPPADSFGQGFAILEGPVWIGDALYLSQIASNSKPPPARLLKLVPATSTLTIAAADFGSNGLAVDGNGALVGGVHKDGSVSRFSLATLDQPVPLAASFMGARFNSPNDLAIRSDGNIYFSDPDYQAPAATPQAKTRVYRIAPGGVVSVVDDTLSQPNGITLSLDEATLYVSGSSGLYSYPLMPDGSVGGVKQQVNPSLSGSDGMGIDCAGDLYVAGKQDIVVLDPSGKDIGHIALDTSVQGTTNVAFGGPDRKTLFITSLGSTPMLFSLEMSLPGMPY
jgi:gluconolactonase